MKTKTKSPKLSFTELLDSWEPIDEDFPAIADLPHDPVDLGSVESGSEEAFREFIDFLHGRRSGGDSKKGQ